MVDQPKTFVQLHLGLGSFHRAHQAVYLQDLHDRGDTRWHIIGANIRNDMQSTLEALRAQNGEYHVETVSPQGERQYQKVSAIQSIIDWDEGLHNLVPVVTDPNTRIISFTVTEAGYYLDDEKQLDTSSPEIQSDLSEKTVKTIYGALAFLLLTRKAEAAGPITLLNCDNLRSNGECFWHGFTQFLEARNEQELLNWASENVSAPNSMVDRITPMTNAEHIVMHTIPLKMSELEKDKPIVFYCRTGARSAQVCYFLKQQGFDNAINLRGGIMDWARSGQEVVSGAYMLSEAV